MVPKKTAVVHDALKGSKPTSGLDVPRGTPPSLSVPRPSKETDTMRHHQPSFARRPALAAITLALLQLPALAQQAAAPAGEAEAALDSKQDKLKLNQVVVTDRLCFILVVRTELPVTTTWLSFSRSCLSAPCLLSWAASASPAGAAAC